jgi:hypothetical protein
MIQKLPLEVVTQIASNIPLEDAGEFARTCQKCYFAILPHIWHRLSLHNTTELSLIAERLQSNGLWAQRAIQFVRYVSLTGSKKNTKMSSTLAALMFGIASSPQQQAIEDNSIHAIASHERIGAFGRRILQLFPGVTNLVFDFAEAVKNFYSSSPLPPMDETTKDDERLPYSGSVALVNYKADNTKFMHYLLAPFRKTCHLKVQALPVISFCDDIDESILTNEDIADLATLGFHHLRKLELSYLGSEVQLDTWTKLLKSLPHLKDLDLRWIFPPNKQEFELICQLLKNESALYPDYIESKSNIMQARFIRQQRQEITVNGL